MHTKYSFPHLILTSAATSIFLLAMSPPGHAQWVNYPSAGIPTVDGKPDLLAPAPRTPDGKPRRLLRVLINRAAENKSMMHVIDEHLLDLAANRVRTLSQVTN